MFVKKGDTVKVISGNSKGRVGTVLRVYPKTDKIVVEGVNIVTKHAAPSAAYPDGGIVKKEAPIHLSKVQVVDPKTNEATRVGYKMVDGKKIRYSKKTGNELDKVKK